MTTQESIRTSAGAARWLEQELRGRPAPPLLALIGFGEVGLLETLHACAPGTRLLALEPDAAVAARVLADPACQVWRREGRLVYLADPDYKGADDAWRLFPPSGDPPVLVNPELALGEGVARAAQVLKRILFGVEANREARRRFAPRYLLNSIRNVPGMVAGSDVRALAGACQGLPAVIAAAGPSLDAAMAELRGARARAVIIAVDTALRPLLAAGIAPALVVGVDPGAANLRHFLALPECRDTWLVSESALDRHATASFEGRTFWFRASEHHPWPWLNELGLETGKLEVWGSVVTAAFSVAELAGCDPIVFAGADLAYTDGRPYARGTTYEFDWALAADAGVPLAASWEAQITRGTPRAVPDLHGRDTLTTDSLVSFRDWLVARARRSGRRVVNTSAAGILHGDGVEQQDLAQVLVCRNRIPPIGTVARRFSKVRPSALARRLRAVRDALAKGRLREAPIAGWMEFSGDGFDPPAVQAALEEAANTLETKRGRPEAASPIPWARLGGVGSLVTGLAESVARARAIHAGGTPAAVANAEDRAAWVERARASLDAIGTAILRGPDISPVGDARGPVSGAYAWPETVRWSILLYQAMLGKAAAGPRPRTTAPFFTRPVHPRDAGDAAAASHVEAAYRRLVRQLTDALDERGGVLTVVLPPRTTEALEARILTGTERLPAAPPSDALRLVSARILATPRVLSDEGHPRALVGYATARGVVCVPPYARESILVREDGAVEPHLSWPHPIVGELPFGEGGAVAWTRNDGASPEQEPDSVMYRSCPEASPALERLPFRPSRGIWWDGRLYWSCVPLGLGSWAPGAGAASWLPGLSISLIHPDGDSLVLTPRFRGPDGRIQRRLLPQGWRWRGDGNAAPAPLGPEGGASCTASAGGWTVTAHPEADLLTLASEDGRALLMTCYCPLRLAWAGRSLVVSTTDGELLLFERLLDRLQELSGGR